MEPNEKKFWFPAKRYGYGWGPPVCWQGWVVMILWIMLFVVGAFALKTHMGWFIAFALAMSGVFFLIAWLKGEPPRWRWGGK